MILALAFFFFFAKFCSPDDDGPHRQFSSKQDFVPRTRSQYAAFVRLSVVRARLDLVYTVLLSVFVFMVYSASRLYVSQGVQLRAVLFGRL